MISFFKKKKEKIKEEVNENKDIDESSADLIIHDKIRSINTSDVITPYYSQTSSLPRTPINEPGMEPITPANTPTMNQEQINELKTKVEDLDNKNKDLKSKLNYLEYYYNKEIEYLKYGSIIGLSMLSYYLFSKKNN